MVGAYSKEEIIEINKLSQLHNGSSIVFCKTDFILEEFKAIEQLESDVTLITGNSDYCITEELVALAPSNVKHWFCQNKMTADPRVKSIPIGLENTVECSRPGHGYVWGHASPKLEYLTSLSASTPSKLVYSNFNTNTNPMIRGFVRAVSEKANFITWESHGTDYNSYVQNCLKHLMVVCPEGNGPDTHRFWETLYMGRVPIARLTRATEDFKDLPVVWLNDWTELKDKSLILDKFDKAKSKSRDLCLNSYWMRLIINYGKTVSR